MSSVTYHERVWRQSEIYGGYDTDTACERCVSFFVQAEDGIRDLVRSRGLGDVYKRQILPVLDQLGGAAIITADHGNADQMIDYETGGPHTCLLYTSDAADERSSVDLGGRRIIKKQHKREPIGFGAITKRMNLLARIGVHYSG